MEAFKLITPVVDKEATSHERSLFFSSLSDYPMVRKQFRSAKRIKELIQTRCPKAKAPHPLHKRIDAFLNNDDLQGPVNG